MKSERNMIQSATAVFFPLLKCFSTVSDLVFILDLFDEFLPTHNDRIFVLSDFFVENFQPCRIRTHPVKFSGDNFSTSGWVLGGRVFRV